MFSLCRSSLASLCPISTGLPPTKPCPELLCLCFPRAAAPALSRSCGGIGGLCLVQATSTAFPFLSSSLSEAHTNIAQGTAVAVMGPVRSSRSCSALTRGSAGLCEQRPPLQHPCRVGPAQQVNAAALHICSRPLCCSALFKESFSYCWNVEKRELPCTAKLIKNSRYPSTCEMSLKGVKAKICRWATNTSCYSGYGLLQHVFSHRNLSPWWHILTLGHVMTVPTQHHFNIFAELFGLQTTGKDNMFEQEAPALYRRGYRQCVISHFAVPCASLWELGMHQSCGS